MPLPETVLVGDDLVPERIAPGVVLHPGCRLYGAATSIGPGSVLGEEQPVTVKDCQLGHEVRLKGGLFEGATFLDGANMGSGAHVRAGTLLEEEASGAHTVGLKQTVLLPFVTLGSLINFCDCLMAGGTSRRDHSEVGSSYVHFNYTPHQDKATASLLGDVPRGVMLDQAPIFLGGQGGLVGPCRLDFGTVVAAGSVCRKDQLVPGRLVVARPPPGGVRTYHPGVYGEISRTVANNLRLHRQSAGPPGLVCPRPRRRGGRRTTTAVSVCQGRRSGCGRRWRSGSSALDQLAGNMAASMETLAAAGSADRPGVPVAAGIPRRHGPRWKKA